uniref:DUF4216 domain-containing protein n=1 Tax=Chenopodium quinoa TaxID=63459 RepID=A0A803NAG0_CHEQI
MHFSSAKDNRPVLCKMQYYGVIKEICELHYSDFSVPVFCCKWADNNNNVVHDDMGHTSMNLHKIGHKEDPYILACQAKQVFYMTDPPYKRRLMEKKRKQISSSQETAERTVCTVVGKAIQNGTKIPLQWNHRKLPCGDHKATFATYIGVVARQRKAFIVPEDRRGYVLKQASKRWRAFKFRLRKEFMYESDEEGNITDVIIWTPPQLYPWITIDDWKMFVETYTHLNFKAKELQEQGVQVADVPRHLVWIEAHSREEKGILKFDSPPNLEIAQAIKALEAQHNQGKIDATGRNDILARALKTPEHDGCVRGVGGGATNKEYSGYNKPTPPNQLQSELKEVKEKLANVTNTQTLLMSFIMSNFHMTSEQLHQLQLGDEGAQYASMATQGVQDPKRDIEKESVSEKSFNPNLESQPELYTTNQAFLEGNNDCSLAIEQANGIQITAIGQVYIGKESKVIKHHFNPISSGRYRVCIKKEIYATAPLPFPEGKIRLVSGGKNHFLLWPTHLVFPIKKVDKQSVKELNTLSTQMPSSHSSFTKRVLAPIAPEEKLKLTTTLMRVCRKLAVEMKNGGKTIPIRIPNNVFYNEQDVCIDYEDMPDWCYQRMIGASHISTFM